MRALFVVSILVGLPSSLSGQVATSAAFREYTRDIGDRIILAAEAMPAELYSFRATPPQPTFGALLAGLAYKTYELCAGLSGASPTQGADSDDEGKSTLVERVRASFGWCDQALEVLDDERLPDTVRVDLREAFPFAPRARTRAMTMVHASAYWSQAYTQLAQYLRLNGRIPPIPCGRDSDDTTSCDAGLMVCRPTLPRGARVSRFILSDAPYSVRSDGRGDYVRGQDGAIVAAGNALVLFWPIPLRDAPDPRTVTVDLGQPVPDGGGTPRGVIRSHGFEIMAQWYKEADQTQHSVLEIPIGSEVRAEQANVVFNIDGVRHALQMGPQPLGHCFSDGSATKGDGTTRATIRRATETQWIVELPPGSVGRLFDVHLGEPNALDLGLYYVSFRFVIQP